ncbi:hypothetical protein EKD04_017925 [Chloroflexales bacterium ZM16-3]|nr:hypothetical protein [Chloroflexales bacterium ZM16-3]
MQREPLGGVGENRIWSILTIENAAGAAAGGGAMYGLAQTLRLSADGFGAGFWLQLMLIALGAIIGAAVTIRVRGLSLVDRIILFVSFQIRKASGQHRVVPPLESSIWALGDASDDLLPLIDDDMLAALNEGLSHG